jgi:hypothetical protein
VEKLPSSDMAHGAAAAGRGRKRRKVWGGPCIYRVAVAGGFRVLGRGCRVGFGRSGQTPDQEERMTKLVGRLHGSSFHYHSFTDPYYQTCPQYHKYH